jgi:hypothetical protein
VNVNGCLTDTLFLIARHTVMNRDTYDVSGR